MTHWLVERARVVDRFSEGVWIETQRQQGCRGCSTQGCGRGLLARWRRPARLALYTEASLSLSDEVQVGVPATGMLYGALAVYGWPLLVAFLTAGAAERLMSPGHGAVPLVFMAGLLLGSFMSRWRLSRAAHRYRPVLLATAAGKERDETLV